MSLSPYLYYIQGLDNLDGLTYLIEKQSNAKIVVLVFALFHGFGLVTKLQEFRFDRKDLLVDSLGFNLRLEIGSYKT